MMHVTLSFHCLYNEGQKFMDNIFFVTLLLHTTTVDFKLSNQNVIDVEAFSFNSRCSSEVLC